MSDALHIIETILLPRLQGVKKAPAGARALAQWRALCPACQQNSKSKDRKLSVAVGQNGSVLVHCRKCNSGLPALDALGLSFADLYPRLPEGQHFAKGNGGPGAWLSHAALVDGLIEAHTQLLGLVAQSLHAEAREQALALLLQTRELAQQVRESARMAYRAAAAQGGRP